MTYEEVLELQRAVEKRLQKEGNAACDDWIMEAVFGRPRGREDGNEVGCATRLVRAA